MTQPKLPKFLVCSNLMANSPTYILHTRTPRFIVEVKPSHKLELVVMIDGYSKDLEPILKRMADWWLAYCNYQKKK